MWGGDIRVGWDVALAALVLSFVLCASLAWIYRATYQGLSFQRGQPEDSCPLVFIRGSHISG